MVVGNAVMNYREQIWEENSNLTSNSYYIKDYISNLYINPLVQGGEERKLSVNISIKFIVSDNGLSHCHQYFVS